MEKNKQANEQQNIVWLKEKTINTVITYLLRAISTKIRKDKITPMRMARPWTAAPP